jgi:acyl-CoA thioesterase FadM
MKIAYELVDTQTGQLLVLGHTRHICVDRQKRVARIPEAWRAFFAGTCGEP